MNNYQFDIMERCDFMPLTAELASLPFCCGETEGDKDLEDFFHHNALLYAQERLGKTYCFINNEGEFSEIVAFFTVSNDSVKTTLFRNLLLTRFNELYQVKNIFVLILPYSWLLMRIISQKFLAFMSATSSSIYMPQRN